MFKKLLPVVNYLVKNKAYCHSFSHLSTFMSRNVLPSENHLITSQIRTFAKGKDKKKDKGKSKKIVINENEIGEVLDVEKLKTEMLEAINNLRHDYIHKISLRSTTGGIDTLRFSHKGEKIDLLEVAKINRSNPDIVIIDMASTSHLLPTVMKVISSSGMNLNPHQDGTSIIVPIPQMSQQYKDGLTKSAKAMFIKCRDIIKDTQNKHLKILKNKSKEGVSEDMMHRVSEQIILMGNTYISDAEKLLQKKQDELTS